MLVVKLLFRLYISNLHSTFLPKPSQHERNDKRSQAARVLGGAGGGMAAGFLSQASSVHSTQYAIRNERKRVAEEFVARTPVVQRQRIGGGGSVDVSESDYWRKKYLDERAFHNQPQGAHVSRAVMNMEGKAS